MAKVDSTPSLRHGGTAGSKLRPTHYPLVDARYEKVRVNGRVVCHLGREG
jgi:hypothetical protein